MFKILKEELLFIPLMFVLLEALRWALFNFYPETALFDKGSELETFLFSVWQLVWISSATLFLLYVVFPKKYKAFKDFYHGFDKQEENSKEAYSILFYIVFFLGLVFLVSGKANTINENLLRTKLVDTLHKQLHVRELTGKNDGKEVEKYLTYVGRYKGDAWCAAFTSWNLHAVGVTSPPNPKSGWSPNFATPKYIVWSNKLAKQHKASKPQKGDCFTLYYTSLNRVGHVGFIVSETHDYFITIEGNTGLTGSREGSGVHKYKRAKSKVYAVTNYITPYLKNNEKITYHFNNDSIDKLMPSKTNYKLRKNNGNKYLCYSNERQYFNTRYDSASICRQFGNSDTCYHKCTWRNYDAKNSGEKYTLSFDSASFERNINRKMCLQGVGTNCPVPTTNYRKTNQREPIKTEGKYTGTNHRSKIYTTMGKSDGVHWCRSEPFVIRNYRL